MSDELEGIFRAGPERGRAPQTFRLSDMVRVEIFGLETHLKLGYAEVEKLSFK